MSTITFPQALHDVFIVLVLLRRMQKLKYIHFNKTVEEKYTFLQLRGWNQTEFGIPLKRA